VGRRGFVDVETDGDDGGADTTYKSLFGLQVSNWTDPCMRDIPGDLSSLNATLTVHRGNTEYSALLNRAYTDRISFFIILFCSEYGIIDEVASQK